jgi:hypothetical protein
MAQLSALAVWKAGVPMGVLVASYSRPEGACLTPGWPATAVAAALFPEWTAHLAMEAEGTARGMRAANARMV